MDQSSVTNDAGAGLNKRESAYDEELAIEVIEKAVNIIRYADEGNQGINPAELNWANDIIGRANREIVALQAAAKGLEKALAMWPRSGQAIKDAGASSSSAEPEREESPKSIRPLD